MDWKKIAGIAGLGLLATAAMSASHAQGTASATLSSFTYTLIDLDLNDGITPSLTLTNSHYWIATAAYPDGSGYPDPVDIINYAGTAHVGNATGNATSGYDGKTASAVTNVSGLSPRFSSDAIVQWNFALTPNTAAVIMGYGSINAEDKPGVAMDAYAQLFAAYKTNPGDLYETYLDDSIFAYYDRNQSKVLNVTFSSGDSQLDGRLGLFVSAAGQSFAAPVPEPETYAMLICGLVILASARRRSKS
ncbi:PEP-CTERM sorting domain-containing protein [Duganella sp. PWIR1]